MKILLLSQVGQSLYGANRSLLDIATGLKEKGHDIRVVVASRGELSEKLKLNKIPIFIFRYHGCAHSLKNKYFLIYYFLYFFNKFYLSFNIRKLGNWRPEIVYTNNTTVDIGYHISIYFHCRHVWHVREFGWDDYSLLYFPSKKSFLRKLNQSDFIIFISNSLFATYDGLIDTKYRVLKNPISESLLRKRKLKKKKTSFVFLFPGLIHPNKGQLLALKAFRILQLEYPQTKIVFIGGGSFYYKLLLVFYCYIFNLKNAILLGYQSDVANFFHTSDAVLVCSKKEALGRVTLEAMMYGVPIIGNNTAGTKELIGDTRGLTFDGTSIDLYNKMKVLILNYNLCQKYSNEGINFINSYFIKKPYIDNLEKLLLSLQ